MPDIWVGNTFHQSAGGFHLALLQGVITESVPMMSSTGLALLIGLLCLIAAIHIHRRRTMNR